MTQTVTTQNLKSVGCGVTHVDGNAEIADTMGFASPRAPLGSWVGGNMPLGSHSGCFASELTD